MQRGARGRGYEKKGIALEDRGKGSVKKHRVFPVLLGRHRGLTWRCPASRTGLGSNAFWHHKAGTTSSPFWGPRHLDAPHGDRVPVRLANRRGCVRESGYAQIQPTPQRYERLERVMHFGRELNRKESGRKAKNVVMISQLLVFQRQFYAYPVFDHRPSG